MKKILLSSETVSESNGVTRGIYKGYYITSQQDLMMRGIWTIKIGVSSETDPQNVQLQQNIKEILIRYPKVKFAFCSGTLIILNVSGIDYKSTIVDPCIDEIIMCLSVGNYEPCCELCGAVKTELRCIQSEGNAEFICGQCAQNKAVLVNNNKPKEPNIGLGIVGAVIGALLGGAVWFLISTLGYVAAISGMLIVLFSLFGFKKLGGGINTGGVVAVAIISIITVYIANRASYAYTLMGELNEVYEEPESIFYYFRYCTDLLKELDIVLESIGETANVFQSYVKDLVIGYILFIVGSASIIMSEFKRVKTKGKIREI